MSRAWCIGQTILLVLVVAVYGGLTIAFLAGESAPQAIEVLPLCEVGKFLTGSGGCKWPALTEFVPDLPPRLTSGRDGRFVSWGTITRLCQYPMHHDEICVGEAACVSIDGEHAWVDGHCERIVTEKNFKEIWAEAAFHALASPPKEIGK